MDSLFDPVAEPERTAFLRRLRALIAPVAADAGSVVDDPALLDIAQSVYAAFGEAGASGGLTRAQIAAGCPTVRDQPEFGARLDLFARLGMLQPVFDKLHQQRWVFNPTSAAGLLVFERLAERGGVDELMSLLDRTRLDLRAGIASREQIATNLRSARHLLTVFADHLLRLVTSAPLSELIAERRHHEHTNLVEEIRALTVLVADTFPDLDPQAYRVVVEAQRYVGAREAFVTRLLEEGAASRDFSLLDPEEYLTAARTGSLTDLAAVFARTVFDPPCPWVDPTTVAEAVGEVRPRPAVRQRPPRPFDEPAGEDPLDAARARADAARRSRARQIDILLGSDSETELVDAMRIAGWPRAATVLAHVLAAAADPTLRVTVSMSDELLVEPDGPITYLTPVLVRRPALAARSRLLTSPPTKPGSAGRRRLAVTRNGTNRQTDCGTTLKGQPPSGPGTLTRVLHGDAPSCMAYLDTATRPGAPSLVSQRMTEMSPERIGESLIALTGWEGLLDSAMGQRRNSRSSRSDCSTQWQDERARGEEDTELVAVRDPRPVPATARRR